MAIAKLSVDLELLLAKFQGDSGRAALIAEKLAAKIEKIGFAAGATVGASALAGAAAVAWLDKSIRATAELKGIGEQAQISAAGIASLRTASDTSGVSLGRIAELASRLNTTLSKPLSIDRGAGAALKAIGLTADELRRVAPDEAIEKVARALAGYADGAGRGAAATLILGKGAAAAMPFLNDLAELGRSQIKLTDEQIAAADAYAKAQDRARSELQQTAAVLAVQAAPAMLAFTEALRDTIAATIGVDRRTQVLGQSTAVADFAEKAVTALGFVVDAGDGVTRVFSLVGKTIGGYAAVAGALLRGDVDQAKQIGAEFRADADALLQAPLFSTRLAERLAAAKRAATADAPKPLLKFQLPDTKANTGAVKASTSAFDNLLRSIVAKTSAAEAELAGTDRLSESQRFAIDIVTKLAATEGKYTTAQKQAAGAALESYLALAGRIELTAKQADALEQLLRRERESADAIDREADSRIAGNQALRDALQEYGRTGAEIEELRIRRIEHALAIEREALAVGRARDLSIAEAAGLERNIKLLEEQVRLRREGAAEAERQRTDPFAGATTGLNDYLQRVQEAGFVTRDFVTSSLGNLENDLVASFTSGKPSIKSFVDFTIGEFYRLLVVRPLLASIAKQLQDLTSSASGSSGVGALLKLFGAGSGISVDAGGISTNFTGGSLPTAGGAAGGTNFVERDMLTIIHRGEAIVPKAFNPFAPGGHPGVQRAFARGGEQATVADSPAGREATDREAIRPLTVYVQPPPGMSRDSATQQGVRIGLGIQQTLRRRGG